MLKLYSSYSIGIIHTRAIGRKEEGKKDTSWREEVDMYGDSLLGNQLFTRGHSFIRNKDQFFQTVFIIRFFDDHLLLRKYLWLQNIFFLNHDVDSKYF